MSLQSNAVFQGKDLVSSTMKSIEANTRRGFRNMQKESQKTNSQLALINKDIEKFRRGIDAALGAGFVAIATQAAQAVGQIVDEGAKLGALQSTFQSLSQGRINIGQLKEEIDGTIPSFHLMQVANKGLLLGLDVSQDKLAEMANISRVLGQAMGVEAAQALDDLVTGLGRGSALILDNLGIMVDAKEANLAYAASVGKTVDQLTQAEKKLALQNEALRAAKVRMSDLNLKTNLQADAVQKLKTAWTDFIDERKQGMAEGLAFLLNDLGVIDLSTPKEKLVELKQELVDLQKKQEDLANNPKLLNGWSTGYDNLGGRIEEVKQKIFDLEGALKNASSTSQELTNQEQARLDIAKESAEIMAQIAAMKAQGTSGFGSRPSGPFKEESAGPIDAPVFQFDPAMKELELELGQLELNQKLEMASAIQVMGDAMGYSASVQQQAMAIQRQSITLTGQEISTTQALAAARRQAMAAKFAEAGAIAGQMRQIVGENSRAAKAIAAVQGILQIAEGWGAYPDPVGMAAHFTSAAMYFKVAGSSSGGARGGGGAGTTRSSFNALSSASSKDNDRGTIVINNNFDENGWNTTIDERSKTAVAMDIHRNNGPVSVALGGG